MTVGQAEEELYQTILTMVDNAVQGGKNDKDGKPEGGSL